eukprot:Em0020g472a
MVAAMASIRLAPPEPFDFSKPDEWPRWKRRFEQFRFASGLSEEDNQRQVCTLLYCLGEGAEDVLSSTNISGDERKAYSAVLKKFDDFFQIRKNIIFERARFNRRDQLDGETADEYISALHNLAESCEYGTLKSELIRDRLVVGIRDLSQSRQLQLDSTLTLEKATKAVRQREAVTSQQNFLAHDSIPDSAVVAKVDAMAPKVRHQPKIRQQASDPTASTHSQCPYCGGNFHPRERCRAKHATCFKCQKRGHFDRVCRSTRVEQIHSQEHLVEEELFLDAVQANGERAWFAQVSLFNTKIKFKLDTGAEVTAISLVTYEGLKPGKHMELGQPSKILYGPGNQALNVAGQFDATLAYKGTHSHQTIFVVKGLKTNLLGLPALRALKLIARVDSVEQYEDTIRQKYPKLFTGLGNMGVEYSIKLRPNAKPYALSTPRNIPLPLRSKVKEELTKMEKSGVISRVEGPTEWCAGMVVVPKKQSDSVRICVDLKPLNESVLRENYPLPKIDETLAQLSGASVFSKLDANSGFWQISLAKDCRPLTTFITPFGRYFFNKLPFGISSASELFQRRMSEILDGLDGVLCQIDDILIFGNNQHQHDIRLMAALDRIEKAGVTLNPTKCVFSRRQIQFLGHIIDQKGVHPDPDKTSAIHKMPKPENVSELRRFLGMINQFGKFSPHLSELSQPLRELLSTRNAWLWGAKQDLAFSMLKNEITKPAVLALYDPAADTKVSADASSYGLGAVLLQRDKSSWKPVAFASRSMSDTEKRYAQIEKEALAIVWACDKFSTFVIGKHFTIETDHKPLIPLLSTKHLDSLPPRILRFRLRMARYDYSIEHKPGKQLFTADTLSRAPCPTATADNSIPDSEVELFVEALTSSTPITKSLLERYRSAQQTDPVCTALRQFCLNGWPSKQKITTNLKPFWLVRNDLSICNDLLLYGSRIIVPASLHPYTLQKLHDGHLGIQQCRLRATAAVWWPGLSQQIHKMIQDCHVCTKRNVNPVEPMIPTALPKYPWQKIASDIFMLHGHTYLIIVDYFSRFPEVIQLPRTTSQTLIESFKLVFAHNGIPEELVTDNGPQYTSKEMKAFAASYGFQHTTSSPYYPRGNGLAERTVKTIKALLQQADDPQLALLNYRATPLPWCGLSPAELLFGRRIRTTIPQITSWLIPEWSHLKAFYKSDELAKRTQKDNYDKRHGARAQSELNNETEVWVRTGDKQTRGRIVATADTPRSYIVSTSGGIVRRNRQHLITVPGTQQDGHSEDKSNETLLTEEENSMNDDVNPSNEENEESENVDDEENYQRHIQPERSSPIAMRTRSRTGIAIRPPDRL